MKHSGGQRNLIGILVVALLLVIAVPATSFGKDRGRRGRGRDFDNRKCGKFVNCHDARDGRWDGRGPRRDRFSRWDWRDNRSDNDRWRDGRRRDRRWDSRINDNRRWDGDDWRNRWTKDRRRVVRIRDYDGRYRRDRFRDRWR